MEKWSLARSTIYKILLLDSFKMHGGSVVRSMVVVANYIAPGRELLLFKKIALMHLVECHLMPYEGGEQDVGDRGSDEGG